ncbi:MAG: cytoplasmic iron level regulating protein YaaA (DUF328/UPF0246 family) [Nonlabens sp.]|jgi:cytoplasmic iron level regulating protein YaaA (DUF328/UPF0246 family)
MIILISPAKTLDFENKVSMPATKPRLFNDSKAILEVMKEKTPEDLSQIMSISEDLAELNAKRFKKFSTRHTAKNSKQSLLAFKGDVYLGLQAEDFTEAEMDFAQEHLRILSGLYGVLRPLDLMQPYRLEMGTKVTIDEHSNLYKYWGEKPAKLIRRDMLAQKDDVVLNLASIEYFKAVNLKTLKAKVIDFDFQDFHNGEYKMISFFAKRARGMMARYIIKNQLSTVADLKGFNTDGYYFDTDNSTESSLSYKRG